MRILHTADWHLCDRLGRLDRTADLKARVELVADYCEQKQVELLLVAGDLFYERATAAEMADALLHVRQVFRPFFERGGTILAVTGNHDDDARIDLIRAGSFLASPLLSGGVFQRGRLYLQNGLSFGKFTSPAGETLQVVLVPFPKASRFELGDGYRTREEEHLLLRERLTTWTAELFTRPEFDQTLPTVLVAHLHVRGANLNRSLFRMSDAEDVMFEPAALKAGWAYVALGHIHIPQAIDGVDTVRYPGPLDRLDFGEKDDPRGVLLVNIDKIGVTGPVETLPLVPTPMHHVALTDPDTQLDGLADRYPDRDTAIVRAEVTHTADGTKSRDEIVRTLRNTFPRLHQVTWVGDTTGPTEPTAVDPAPAGGRAFADTVRDYLKVQLAGDPDAERVLALADSFLSTTPAGDPL